MSEHLGREAVDRLRRYPRSRLLDHEADIAALLADWERLRGLIVETAETVNLALICANSPPDISGQIMHEAAREMAGRLLAEARAIRDEDQTL